MALDLAVDARQLALVAGDHCTPEALQLFVHDVAIDAGQLVKEGDGLRHAWAGERVLTVRNRASLVWGHVGHHR